MPKSKFPARLAPKKSPPLKRPASAGELLFAHPLLVHGFLIRPTRSDPAPTPAEPASAPAAKGTVRLPGTVPEGPAEDSTFH